MLWRIIDEEITLNMNLPHNLILTVHFQHLAFSMDYFLPSEKCQEGTVVPWLPPLRYNNPPVLHSEQAKLNHRYSRNQEYKGLKVRCCWNLNNRN